MSMTCEERAQNGNLDAEDLSWQRTTEIRRRIAVAQI